MKKDELKPIDVRRYKVTETGQVLKMTKDSLNKELAKKADTNHALVLQLAELEAENAELKEQIDKMKYTLNKIIETVHNEKINEYGARLVVIHDFAYECLEGIK